MKDSHQLELTITGKRHSWYALFNHIVSSSQLFGEALSRAEKVGNRDDERTRRTDLVSAAAERFLSPARSPLPAPSLQQVQSPALPSLARRPLE